MKHLDWEILMEIAESGASSHEGTDEHLASCPSCREQLAQVRTLVQDLGYLYELPQVPQSWIEGALSKIVRRPTQTPEPERGWRRQLGDAVRVIRASLVASSMTPSPLFRAGALGPRSLVFETHDHIITLRITRHDAGGPSLIQGQIVPRPGATLGPEGVASCRVGNRRSLTKLSPLGEFSFETTSPDPHQLSIEWAAEQIDLAEFRIDE